MYISILHISLKGSSFRYCAKNRFVPPQSYYVYSDIERIDSDFDIVTNVQVVGCQLPPLHLTHTSPDTPISSYLLLVRFPSRKLQKTLKGMNGRQKTYEIFHVYCIFYSGFMCQTTVIFGITKDGSLESNNLAS